MANRGLGYALQGLTGLAQGYMSQQEKNRLAEQQEQENALKRGALDLQNKKSQIDIDKIVADFGKEGMKRGDSGFEIDQNWLTPGTPEYLRSDREAALKALSSAKAGGAAPLTADAISRLRAAYAKGDPIPEDLKNIAIPSGYSNMFASGKPPGATMTAGQIIDAREGRADPGLVIPPAYAGSVFVKQAPPEQVALTKARTGLAEEQANRLRNAQPPLSKAQEAIDQVQGKNYADYFAEGGRATVDSGLTRLERAKKKLLSGEAKTGVLPGIADKIGLGSILTPDTAAAKDEARTALYMAMRPLLGAQFTEKEGERVLNQVWDPFQSPAVNMQKIDDQIAVMRAQAADKDAAARVYEDTGSFKDYVPSRGAQGPVDRSTLYGNQPKATAPPAADARATSARKLGVSAKQLQAVDSYPRPGDVRKGYRYRGGNPSDKNNWEKVK